MKKSPEYNNPIIPGTLDLVILDGRWAQVNNSGIGVEVLISYLDNGETANVTWADYQLENYFDSSLALLLETNKVKITNEEKSQIHWDVDQSKNLKLVDIIIVFGVYKKK